MLLAELQVSYTPCNVSVHHTYKLVTETVITGKNLLKLKDLTSW